MHYGLPPDVAYSFGAMARLSFFSRLAALGLAVSTAACAGGLSRGASPRGEGGGWSEVTTDHFTLRTDLAPDEAVAAGKQLETIYGNLAEVGFASEDRPKAMIDVVYFRRHQDYVTLRPQATAGQFMHGGIHDFERRPTAVLGGDLVESTRRLVQHELTHVFVRYYYPRAPVWLNEGLARYLETLTIEDGRAIVGRPPREARFWKGPWKVTSERGTIVAHIPVEEAPTVNELRAMAGSFYVDVNANGMTAEGRESIRAMQGHYQGAWCLVHLLLENAAYSKAFGDYLTRLHAGEGDEQAWRATLGALPSDQLEADYHASLAPREVTTMRMNVTPVEIDPPEVRSLFHRDVRVLWARLRDWENPEAREAAARDLDALDPNELRAEEVTTLAAWAVAERRPAEARTVLESALKREPGDRRLLNALGWILFEEMRAAARTHANGKPEDGKRLDAIARELQTKADTAPELDLAARVLALEGDADGALALEERAYKLDPSCGSCLLVSAEMLAKKGRYKEAIDAETLALRPDAPIPPSLVAQMNQWRRLAASPGEAPSASTTPAASVAVPHADAVLASLRAKFRPCFGEKPPKGSVEFDVRVAASGAVSDANPRSGATFAPSVVQCLGDVLKAAHFPAPGADASLRVPISIGGS
jgi:tetratricopeptide (TPR) repeat protein